MNNFVSSFSLSLTVFLSVATFSVCNHLHALDYDTDEFTLDIPEGIAIEKDSKTPELKPFPEVHDELKIDDNTLDAPDLELKLDEEETPAPTKESLYTEEEKTLREKVLQTLRTYEHIGLCTEENRPIDVISFIVPYGCEAEIFYGPREANRRINAIGALCWNVPLSDESAFTDSTEKLMPRLGYGIQQYSGQLLAALAIARVPLDYRFPAGFAIESEATETTETTETATEKDSVSESVPRGKKRFGIQNLVEFEQKNCQWGRDLSQTLIGLSYYLPLDDQWKANDGETWTLERLVQNELERPIFDGDTSATNRLLGLLCAIRCRQMRTQDAPLTGQYARADSYLQRFRTFVLDIQNSIGVWHPTFFQKKGVTPDQPTEMLIASGHILRWLVTVTPRQELNDPRIIKSVTTIQELLDWQLTYWDPTNASGTEIEGVMTALHALTIYEKRRFK